MPVWVVRAGRGGLHADAFEELGVVALSVEPVPSVAGLSQAEIIEHAVARPDVNAARARGHAAMLFRFANEIHVGDLVVTPDAENATVLVGRVVGGYEYRHAVPIPGHRHVRRVAWFGRMSRGRAVEASTTSDRRADGGLQARRAGCGGAGGRSAR
jgi:restriction system protein